MKRLLSMFAVALVAAAVPAFAQQNPPPPSPPMAPYAPGSPSDAPTAQPQQNKKWGGSVDCSHGKCKATGKGNADQSPDGYPSFPASALAPDAPDASSAQQNPFPEAKSEAAQKKAQQGDQQPPPSKEPSSSSDQRLAGMNVLGDGGTAGNGAGKRDFNPNLAAKDNKVGGFYLASGDYVGAYSRFKEATQVDPGNAQSVFGLAEASDRLGKREEAIRNFQIYLSAVHKGHDAKVARKNLKRLMARR